MDQLNQSDYRRLIQTIGDCYAIPDFESFENFPRKLLNSLSQLIPSVHATYSVIRPGSQEIFNIGSTEESSSPEAGRLLAKYLGEHPAFNQFMRTGDGSGIRLSDCANPRQFHNTGLYNFFYRQYDIEDDLCLGFAPDATQYVTVVWHRDRRFTDRERMMASLLFPHFVQAWRNARMVRGILGQQQLLQGCLEGAEFAVIACDAEGRVQFVNAMARRYLAQYFGDLRDPARRLPAEIHDWLNQQNGHGANGDEPTVRLPLSLSRGNSLLTVQPLSSAGGYLLLLKESVSDAPVDLCEGFGLSRRELEVLFRVAQGKTNAEISSLLGISVPTAKKHMEHILRKLQVETRTAAAALALHSLSRKE